jgi:hypothetical protein
LQHAFTGLSNDRTQFFMSNKQCDGDALQVTVPAWQKWATWLVVACFTLTLATHAAAIARLIPSPDSSPSRHAVFVLLNGAGAVLFLRRYRHTWLLLLPWFAQQAYSHGGDGLEARARGELDWQSLAVLLFFPCAWALALTFRRRQRRLT